MFVYELSGCGFESSCSQYQKCLNEGPGSAIWQTPMGFTGILKKMLKISHVKGTKTFLWKLKNLKKVHSDAVLVAADKVGLNLSIS